MRGSALGSPFLGVFGGFYQESRPLPTPFGAAPLPPQREDPGVARGRGATSVRRDVSAA